MAQVKNQYTDTDIAIVGMACNFPDALNVTQYWENLVNGVDSIKEAPPERVDPMYFQKEEGVYDRFYFNRGGFCDIPFIDPMRYGFLPVAARGMEPEHLFAMKVAYDALEDAGVFEKNIPLQSCCVILGKGNFGNLSSMRNMDIINTAVQVVEVVKACIPGISDEDLDRIKKAYQATKGNIRPDTAIALMPNLIAALITNKLDMHGPAYTVDGACASSTIAINHACELLLNGQCDIALAGGIHAAQSAMFWASFNMLGAVSRKGVVSPFSEDADGLLTGEGGGVLVLKKLKKAIQDEDRIYAVIKSSAIFSDGSGVSVMAPNTLGQQKALELAWKRAGMDPKHIGMIEAHGTATIAGDKVEITTLNEFFGKDSGLSKAWLGSVKSNIGHAMPAAGMAGVIKTALALYHRKIPRTLHAEKPAKALIDSRFLLPQDTIEWDESKYPLIAGVNAFGFGGINSHVILTAYEEKPKSVSRKLEVKQSFKQAQLYAASSKEELLEILEKKSLTPTSGNYKLVIFDPTPERIEKAKSIVKKDKPWKGRMDIWFSNKPLLEKEGKLAFLFSGFNMEMDIEVDSIADYFDLERPKNVAEQGMLNHSLKLYQINNLLDTALKKLHVVPDMNAGHSIGEWHAGKAAGLISGENVEAMMNAWLRDLNQEIDENKQAPNDDFDSHFEDAYFVAVGCGYEKLQPIIQDIPDLYLSNDNCNNQILMCGKRDAIDEMTERLRKEQIYNQELPYKSAYHTPFLAKHIGILDYCLDQIEELREPEIPIWSATSLETYPTQMDEYRKLTIEHLTSPIRFRELIGKLYDQEKARVFVQIGSGPLTGFVDDILRDKKYGVISTHNPAHSGVEQLRRVLALLYIEGKLVDTLFIRNGEVSKILGQEFEIDSFAPIVTDFPEIREVLKRHQSFNTDLFEDEGSKGRPLLQKMNESMKEMSLVQQEMIEAFNEIKLLDEKYNICSENYSYKKKPEKVVQSGSSPKPVSSGNKDWSEEIVITTQKYPYITDHTVVKQPQHWSHVEDLDIVVPMTMSIELTMEMVQRQVPDKKILGLSSFSIFQWMNVREDFKLSMKGTWLKDNLAKLEMKNFTSTEIIVGNEYSSPPEQYMGTMDLGKTIMNPPTRKFIYEDLMFHGPNYQGVLEVTEFAEKGLRANVKNVGGKGSLLDTLGQLIGIYLRLVVDENNVSFPVKVGELQFYQDFTDQEGVFEFTLIVHEISEEFIIGDMILKRDGKIWCVAKDWLNRRFELDVNLWNIVNSPLDNKLGKSLQGTPVTYYDLAYTRTGSWGFVEKRYLNYLEKEHYNSLLLN
ncbi:MAG: acyltransferase domain-containing protein, partial [Bacteroidales bacterium]|nr:acyltransferase domain-containing protein [Bacteroidales bacterium]